MLFPPFKINLDSVCTHRKLAILYLTSCIEEKLDIIPPVCMCQGTESLGLIFENSNLIFHIYEYFYVHDCHNGIEQWKPAISIYGNSNV